MRKFIERARKGHIYEICQQIGRLKLQTLIKLPGKKKWSEKRRVMGRTSGKLKMNKKFSRGRDQQQRQNELSAKGKGCVETCPVKSVFIRCCYKQ